MTTSPATRPTADTSISTTSSATAHRIRAARVALGWLVEPGNKDLHFLVEAVGPVAAVERLAAGEAPDKLAAAARTRLGDTDPWAVAQRLLERADRLGVRLIIPEDAQWPAAINDLALISVEGKDRIERDTYPPHCLWVRGPHQLDEAVDRSVAIVGARASTHYGAHVAAEMAYGLADREWTVISGGAYGIDAAAHRAALAGGGLTIAVLACGVDRPYPPSNSALFERIADDGLLISEWPPGSDPHRHRFLVRNRLIAALARGTVLVEASARSGARQTLRRTRQLRRHAMVVPGPVTSEASVGCHEELRGTDGPVHLVTGVAHVLEQVSRIGEHLTPQPRGPQQAHDGLDPVDQQLFDAVPVRGAASASQIAFDSGVPLRDALAKLPSLALRGLLQERAGGYARKITRRPRAT
jgi:DNA processing protein